MTFGDADLTRDAFLDGRLTLWQPRDGYRAAIDPVLLAAFVPARPGAKVLELGCGAGAAVLCLGTRVAGLELHGLELQPPYAELARRNAAANRLALVVHEGDLRRPPPELRAMSFDHVLANPPFHPPNAPAAGDPGRDTAHREGAADLAGWIDAALRRLAPRGRLALIHRADRLGAILASLEGRAGSVEILPIAPRASAPAGRVLVRARKGARGATRLWPPFTMHEENPDSAGLTHYTRAAQQVLRGMGALLPDLLQDRGT